MAFHRYSHDIKSIQFQECGRSSVETTTGRGECQKHRHKLSPKSQPLHYCSDSLGHLLSPSACTANASQYSPFTKRIWSPRLHEADTENVLSKSLRGCPSVLPIFTHVHCYGNPDALLHDNSLFSLPHSFSAHTLPSSSTKLASPSPAKVST